MEKRIKKEKEGEIVNRKIRMVIMIMMVGLAVIMSINFTIGAETVGTLEATVCCEKTQSGLYCQNVPSSECASDSQQVPTACESTSFCRPGVCYDSIEGTCSDNTPQLVCNKEDGTWSEESPAQCGLGCCVLGDQAAFVTLVRCKKLSGFLGLETSYNQGITDEVSCVLSVANQDKGACVFESEFERNCKYITRSDCNDIDGSEFNIGKLCSAPELGTICGPTKQTTCVPGKDEVYFVDSCGNPGNVYDSSKVNDEDDYWANVYDKSEACNPGSENANSAGCGNCNYLLGSTCRDSDVAGGRATYGDNICADLNCKDTSNGQSYKHGESWCVYDDEGSFDESDNSVGSRFYKHICINGEEVLEQCADFRQEECVEDKIETSVGDFAQAACRVNRWQDCVAQVDKDDCENTDRRDCVWQDGAVNVAVVNRSQKGICLPLNTPGIKFWEGEEAQSICAQGNAQCVVSFEKGLFGDEECVSNCDCLTDKWEKQHADICVAFGDCGPKINWQGDKGYKDGFKVEISNFESGKE